MRRRFLCLVGLLASVYVSALCTAQETAAPAADPLTRQIGEEMDRRAAEAAANTDTANIPPPPTSMSSALRSLSALFVVIALILLVYYAARRWGKRVPMLAGAHLGKVLGRLYLDRGTALHFVQVGEKILLIGANANSVSLLGEFSAAGIHRGVDAQAPVGAAAIPFNPDSFLAELRARSQDLTSTQRVPKAEEDEIANLRGDIQRLQRYLREENREHED